MRTTIIRVKQIIDTTLSDEAIFSFMLSASTLIDSVLGASFGATVIEDSSSGTITTLGAEIEKWLTAHMIAATREQQLAEAGAGSARVKFQGQTGLGLDSTMYGQMVKRLDTSGALARLDNSSNTDTGAAYIEAVKS